MADAAIASDFHKALDVKSDFAAEVAFGAIFRDLGTKSGQLLIGEVFGADVDGDAGVLADLFGGRVPDAIDVGKGDDDALLVRDINPSNTCHVWFVSFLRSSTLTLLVLGVGADNHDFAMAPNDFALVANRLNRRSDFHDCSPDLD